MIMQQLGSKDIFRFLQLDKILAIICKCNMEDTMYGNGNQGIVGRKEILGRLTTLSIEICQASCFFYFRNSALL
jgi:hypothetical protein